MRVVKYLFVVALIGLVFLPRWRQTVCDQPLAYSIGQFDTQFGLDRAEFAGYLKDTEKLWEDLVGKDLFVYDEQAEFKVNLIFDDRQKRTLEEERLRQNIENSTKSYESMLAEFEAKNSEFERRVAQYESDVRYWNKRGGAPSEEYNRLQKEKDDLNSMAADLNALSSQINALAGKYNQNVAKYNEAFSVPQTFDQGQYDGRSINVYQFAEEEDLRLVLAHEFGHALNLDHVGDPKAVMHYLLKEQPTDPVRLAEGDRAALMAECRLN